MNSVIEDPIGRVLANLCRTRATLTDKFIDDLGLYRGQAILLLILSHENGLTHSELAERLKISPAAVSKVIKRLESAHYIRRQPDLKDERISRVYLEEASYAVLKEIKQTFNRIDALMLQNFSPEDVEKFRLMISLAQNNLSNYSVDETESA